MGSESGGIVKNVHSVASACLSLSNAVAKCLEEKRVAITLGGDHSLGIGSIHGHARVEPNLSVIWIDSHADINSAVTTHSGNMHGMPVSFLVKEMPKKYSSQPLPGFGDIKPCVSAANFAYIGLRDLDEVEVKILKELRPSITYYSIQDVDQLGIYEVISRTLDKINPSLNRPIHVSFDIDAVDEYFAPSTGTSVPGGLTIREAYCIAETIAKTKLLTGLDVVEVNPLLGSPVDVQRTVGCAMNVLLSFLGKDRMDNAKPPENIAFNSTN
jgi:arginase